jgi:hypothetical protein
MKYSNRRKIMNEQPFFKKMLVSLLPFILVIITNYCSSPSKKESGNECPTDPPPDGYARLCGNLTLAGNVSKSNLENASVYVIGQEENGVKSKSDGYFEVMVELEVSGTLVTKTGSSFEYSFFDTTNFEPYYEVNTRADQYKNYQLIAVSLNQKYGKTISDIELMVGSDSGTSGKTKNLDITLDTLFSVSDAPGQNENLGDVNMKKTGSIKGIVTLQYQTDHTGIDVYIPGTSFMAKTDETGSFTMTGVPEGSYSYLRSEKAGWRLR